LVVAVVAFGMRFFAEEKWQDCCDIAAFALPTVAALVEIFISERSGKATDEKIQKLKDKQLSVHVEGETLYIDEGVG
jgi:hypothetical protein